MGHYDAVPYESLPFAETHPQRMAVLARLFGIRAAPAQACRVLEVGAAAGGNLIPMAWHLRDSEFVGIELEHSQVRQGQRIIGELGLNNLRLLQGDILHLDNTFGEFDYLIAHGVYSWVPDSVRDALLALCHTCLRPSGIAYISYNTQPGWRMRGMLRDMLLFHVRHIEDPLARLTAARGYIDLLATSLPRQHGLPAQYLLEEARYLQTAHPSYVYHEFLEENNQPELFIDFVARAGRHGMRYLCESQLATMFATGLGPEAETFLDDYADLSVHEQYLDFLSQRTFRQSLLCHADTEFVYDIDLGMLDQLACYAQLAAPSRLDLHDNRPQHFTSRAGKPFSVSNQLLKLMLRRLYESYPDALGIRELAVQARRVLSSSRKNIYEQDDSAWQGELFNLFVNQGVQFALEPVHFDTQLGELPCANPLVRVQAREGHNLANVWHEIVYTDAFSQRLIAYLDGTRDIGRLRAQMLRDIQSGELLMPELRREDLTQKQLSAQLGNNIKRLLELFARNGLLQAVR